MENMNKTNEGYPKEIKFMGTTKTVNNFDEEKSLIKQIARMDGRTSDCI